jgi:hypothetical protein
MMGSSELEQFMEELTLLLLYLTSWEEQAMPGAPTIHGAWKNHRFEVLDALAEQGYLETSHRSKSVRITADGVEEARKLQKKYFGK